MNSFLIVRLGSLGDVIHGIPVAAALKQAFPDGRVDWMVDPRYDNVEVYHGGEYGLALKGILALRDILTEPLLPAFQYPIADLFKK